jgi:DNA mismatch endonuclease (patch repair protein)
VTPSHEIFTMRVGSNRSGSFVATLKERRALDTLTPKARSERMSRIRGADTRPELLVRCLVFRLGYRFRLHESKLPGKPDLVFPGRRKVIFVHGCFWHRHSGCAMARLPKSRLKFWRPKLEHNKLRDRLNRARLTRLGWRSLVIWECETRNPALIERRIRTFLEGESK